MREAFVLCPGDLLPLIHADRADSLIHKRPPGLKAVSKLRPVFALGLGSLLVTCDIFFFSQLVPVYTAMPQNPSLSGEAIKRHTDKPAGSRGGGYEHDT